MSGKSQGKRYSQDQILGVLKEIENGASMASVGRAHGVGIQTIYAWRKRYAGIGSSELAELKALQAENARLKRIVASQALDIDALKEINKGKW
jgi:putative transposase